MAVLRRGQRPGRPGRCRSVPASCCASTTSSSPTARRGSTSCSGRRARPAATRWRSSSTSASPRATTRAMRAGCCVRATTAGCSPARSRTQYQQPKGVVGFLTPWNYPLTLAVSDAIPALLAGNAALVKPDVQTSLSALWAIDLMIRAGRPRHGRARRHRRGAGRRADGHRPGRLRHVHGLDARRARGGRPVRRAAHRLLARAGRQERDDHPRRCRRAAGGGDRRAGVLLQLRASCASRWSASTSMPTSTRRSRRRSRPGCGRCRWRRASAGRGTWGRSSPHGSWPACSSTSTTRSRAAPGCSRAAARGLMRAVLLRAHRAGGRHGRHDPVRRGDLRPGRRALPGALRRGGHPAGERHGLRPQRRGHHPRQGGGPHHRAAAARRHGQRQRGVRALVGQHPRADGRDGRLRPRAPPRGRGPAEVHRVADGGHPADPGLRGAARVERRAVDEHAWHRRSGSSRPSA